MEQTLEENEESIAQYFESNIPDDSMVVNVKYNFEMEEDDVKALPDFPIFDIKTYIQDLGCKILFSSAGIHYLGERKQPHIHYNFIITPCKLPSNPSQHRHRWFQKLDSCNPDFLKCSFKFHQSIDKKAPRYSVLSYPLKEGHFLSDQHKFIYLSEQKPMTKEQKSFLMSVGSNIYNTQQGLKLRQDKCEERKKVALNTLYDLCEKNKSKFLTYKEMVVWLDTNYIDTLAIEDYPDPKNYKTNCQKIAVSLGKLKYSDIL